mmetsp:Transcript_26265/g.62453  ORF Transcript_26265/g.62453 Transcript_26265/m.62453 type:complete len:308 (-) Transcript_26265:83-1006(-)|eukprot:CAMPEP_0177589650 /NCGR_PEP_ID=MMETSP0419_2-20121207/6935_1 /TAXON_ID=582737 /ORGANISM="Tetraselmis sp., Strain GSL018" /LENGTH=307 /DNA_ID=CAMNT_0019080055 /DNA_START=807 /DNA_END=1730 /DNA_ORIENTATION=-
MSAIAGLREACKQLASENNDLKGKLAQALEEKSSLENSLADSLKQRSTKTWLAGKKSATPSSELSSAIAAAHQPVARKVSFKVQPKDDEDELEGESSVASATTPRATLRFRPSALRIPDDSSTPSAGSDMTPHHQFSVDFGDADGEPSTRAQATRTRSNMSRLQAATVNPPDAEGWLEGCSCYVIATLHNVSGHFGCSLSGVFVTFKLGEERRTASARAPSETASRDWCIVSFDKSFSIPVSAQLQSSSLRVRVYSRRRAAWKQLLGETHIHLSNLEAQDRNIRQAWPLTGVVGKVDLSLQYHSVAQ